jgi:uncharacterized membrane protein (UPF0127 family)
MKKSEILILNNQKKHVSISVEVALSDKDRMYGLMNRKSLPENEGMLFIFSREQYLNFWMKNTSIPLSIAYIDAYGVIKEIQDMKPMDASITYPSKYPVKYALEVNLGWFEKNNISSGSRVNINGIKK